MAMLARQTTGNQGTFQHALITDYGGEADLGLSLGLVG